MLTFSFQPDSNLALDADAMNLSHTRASSCNVAPV